MTRGLIVLIFALAIGGLVVTAARDLELPWGVPAFPRLRMSWQGGASASSAGIVVTTAARYVKMG